MALTAGSITTTALDILSRYGLGDLSMRRLARELDVQPSALYWHVKDKQELFVLIATRMNAEVDARCPSTSDPLVTAMALRDILLTYRDGAEIMLLGYSIAPGEVHYYTLQWQWASGDDKLDTAIGSQQGGAHYQLRIGVSEVVPETLGRGNP